MKAHSTFFRLGLIGASLLGLAVMFTGCSSCKPGGPPGKAQAYNLHVTLDKALKDSSVEVDVIPVNSYDLERLKTYSVNKYWQAGDPMREDLPKVSFSFLSGNNLERVLKISDPKWQQWTKSGVQYLVLLADLPGVYQDGMIGSQDPRRQLLPICHCYWPSRTKDLVVDVQTSGVRIITPPRPEQILPPGW
jgi:hypothetical protein